MADGQQRQLEPAKAALTAALERRLGTSLGVRLTVLEKLGARSAAALGIAWLLLYAAAAGPVLWWANGGRPPLDGHARLAALIVWAGLHFAVLVAITRLANARALDIVRRDILPFASDGYAAAVAAALARQHASLHFRFAPYFVAAIAAAATAWAIRGEIAPVWWTAPDFPLDLLFGTAATFYQAVLAMKVVVTAAFPRAFAAALERDRQALYPLCPAQSPLIRGLARLNRAILVYWALAFLVWVTVMLLALAPAPYALDKHSPYLFILIPMVAFFSLGGGTLVYLESEAAIRTVVRRYSLARAAPLQREIATLLNGRGESDERSADGLDRLTRLHDQILAGGAYGSRLGTALSVALPFVMPAIGLIEKLFGSGD